MKSRLRIVVSVLIAVLAISVFVWYYAPVDLLKSMNSRDVAVIQLRSGSTGYQFQIENPEDISFLVEAIQEGSFRKSGISSFHKGSWYTMTFCDAAGRELESITVNSDSLIRKDPFFYEAEESMGIIALLKKLEETGMIE